MKKEVLIIDKVGLHARPALILVNAATQCKSKVNLLYKKLVIDAKSIIGVLSAGIPSGSEIVIECQGETNLQAQKDLDFILTKLIENNIIAE